MNEQGVRYSSFLALYKRNRVLDDSQGALRDLPLHRACPEAETCWRSHSPGASLDAWNRITLPYIGPLYASGEARLAVLGLNLNQAGGLFEVSDAFMSLAFLEAVKCSPDWDRSSPTEPMRKRCPERFLSEELKLLAPRALLILGKETLAALPIQCQPGEAVQRDPDDLIRIYRAQLSEQSLRVVNIIHPTAPGGSSNELVALLAEHLAPETEE